MVLFRGFERTTLAYLTPVGATALCCLAAVTVDSMLAGTCFMLFLLMTTTLYGLIDGCSVTRRLRGSAAFNIELLMVGAMVTIFGAATRFISVAFCGEPSWMFPSLSAKTIGISKILVLERSGAVGDLVGFAAAPTEEEEDAVETPPLLVRTIVNLVGLKDCSCGDD